MKTWQFVVGSFLAALIPAGQAKAACPASITDPLQLIDGTTWAFLTQAGDFNPPGIAAIGTFQATFVPTGGTGRNSKGPTGLLTASETVNDDNSVQRLASVAGTYQIYPDCSGGQLQLALGNAGVTYEFVFSEGFSKMYLVSASVVGSYGTPVMRGTAQVLTLAGQPALSCPGGLSSQLQLLDGTSWSFHSEPGVFEGSSTSSVGILHPTFVPAGGNPRDPNFSAGSLSGVVSTSSEGGLSRLGITNGKYQVYPDCSGGNLQFELGSAFVQYEFVFANSGFTEFYLLSTSGPNTNFTDSETGANNSFSDVQAGTAHRF